MGKTQYHEKCMSPAACFNFKASLILTFYLPSLAMFVLMTAANTCLCLWYVSYKVSIYTQVMRLLTCAISKHTCVAALMFGINMCGFAEDPQQFASIILTDQSSQSRS
ncbi:hypothetical protein AMECASPLE_000178 [Ameca splendens]|uniref:Uncharacterized protein n=1 Tax=Ameca splendens TaxID=208324 RepID=A0ABV0YKB2_9TELE